MIVNLTVDSPVYDPHPPHPLTDYFTSISWIYGNVGFKKLERAFHPAGRVVENLITGRSPSRVRDARNLARDIDRAVDATSDSEQFASYASSYFYPAGSSVTHAWDNYRAVASNFARGLRLAAANAARGRLLASSLPYLKQDLIFRLSTTSYGSNGYFRQFQTTDGRGQTATLTLSAPTSFSSPSYGYGSVTQSGLNGSFTSGGATLTPLPSPTP